MPIVELTDNSLYYEVYGEGDPLILIHGLGSSCRDWELQIPSFSERFQTIALDLRGHGRSAKPPGPYSIQLFANDVAGLIRALRLFAVHVVGISLGGMVAFQLALDFPELVQSLVIVNSTPELVARNWKDRIGFLQRLLIVNLMGMEKMGEVLAERFLPDPEHKTLRSLFIQRWSENHKPSYLAAMRAAHGWSVTDRLGEIHSPTLVVAADGDYFPLEAKQEYSRLIPNARLKVIEDSRHALPAEKPDEFNQAVLGFLREMN